MKTFADQGRSRWTALAEDGGLSLSAAGGCLAIGTVGWLLGSTVPALANLSALLVVGAFYALLAVPSLVRRLRPADGGDSAAGGPTLASHRPAAGLRRGDDGRSAA